MKGSEPVPSPHFLPSIDAFFLRLSHVVRQYETREEFDNAIFLQTGEHPPQTGAMFVIQRYDDEHTGRPVFFKDPGIFVDTSYYKRGPGHDFTAMIPYDIEHEKWEAYFSVRGGTNADMIDKAQGGEILQLGTAHKLAIRKAMRLAQKDGNLEQYIAWLWEQHSSFGRDSADSDWQYIQNVANKLMKK